VRIQISGRYSNFQFQASVLQPADDRVEQGGVGLQIMDLDDDAEPLDYHNGEGSWALFHMEPSSARELARCLNEMADIAENFPQPEHG
jgi:hypothetical protein